MSLELTTTVEVTLEPALRTEVAASLDEYFAIQSTIKALETDAANIKARLGEFFERNRLGAEADAGILVEGHGRAKMVYPTKSTLDKKKLVSLGVTMAQIERATVVSPSTPYLKLTAPGKPSKE